MSLLLADVPDLPAELWQLLVQIPKGRVTTYGTLAAVLGDVAAARWVGEFLVDHPHDDTCPCHRVVRKGGEVGLYITGDPDEKIARLASEGVLVDDGRATLGDRLLTTFDCDGPLRRLREEQERLPKKLALQPLERKVRTVAGIDVSYITPQLGVAAYVRVDANSQDVIWSTTITAPVKFPYIPNYLTFRELPLYVKLFEEVRRAGQEANITLVDGNGILHPRRAGSASACGVAVETPTIGVGKKLLCGSVDLVDLPARQPRDVIHNGDRIGVALKAGERSRPFFVSPGHRIDLAGTVDVILQVLGVGRLPIPIALADRLSRQVAQQAKQDIGPNVSPARQ